MSSFFYYLNEWKTNFHEPRLTFGVRERETKRESIEDFNTVLCNPSVKLKQTQKLQHSCKRNLTRLSTLFYSINIAYLTLWTCFCTFNSMDLILWIVFYTFYCIFYFMYSMCSERLIIFLQKDFCNCFFFYICSFSDQA